MASASINVQLTVAHDVETVTSVACLNDDLSRSKRHREKARRDLFLCRDRKRSEQRNAINELELRSGGDGPVDCDELSVGEQCEQRKNRADDHESQRRSDCSDYGR